MTGPQLPSPEHATTLDADLRELLSGLYRAGRDSADAYTRELPMEWHEAEYARITTDILEEFTRLRSRITALEMENAELRKEVSLPATP